MDELIVKHWAVIVGGLAYVGSAVISTMPPKDAEMDWRTIYAWAYDCTHMMLNSRPTVPVDPAKK